MRKVIRLAAFITIVIVFYCCNNFRPKKSLEDLKTAFSIESTNTARYSKFAQVATKEGFDTIAQLFLAVAKSESIHAANYGKVLDKFGEGALIAEISTFDVKSTAENLKAAIKGETYDAQKTYPLFIRDAEQEKNPEIARSFTWAWNGEKKHLNYYRRAAAIIAKGNQAHLPVVWLVCPICGNTYSESDVKALCDFCLTKQEDFIGYRKSSD